MSEVNKDPAIKLFGKTISLPRNNAEVSTNDSSSEPVPSLPLEDHSPPSSSSSPREVNSATEHEAEKDKVIVGRCLRNWIQFIPEYMLEINE